MTQITKNLGLIQAISIGVNPPINKLMIWYNTTPGINRHYYYDVISLQWLPLYGGGIAYTFEDTDTIVLNSTGSVVTASLNEFPMTFTKDDLSGAPDYTLIVPHGLNAELVSFEIWNDKKSPVGSQYIPKRIDKDTHTIDFGEEIEETWELRALKRKSIEI